ncbi:MAG: NFACT family protein [Chloroflexi bacterium]|nr:NFACT family protein [Chloroflexota bacterium]
MNFDTFSIAAIASELRQTVIGGRVQRVTQINSLTYGLEIYVHPVRHYLIISAEPQAPRLHLSSQKVRRGAGNETPLMLVLRKYMHSARLTAIDQPAYERLLYFSFVGPVSSTILAVELLGTRSNLVLLDLDQTILGAARLSKPTSLAPSPRLLVPGQLYQPPPPQLKLSPPDLTELNLHRELAEASPQLSLAHLLTETVTGVSPLLAREIVYRATGDAETTVSEVSALTPLLTSCRQLFEHLWQEQWQPTLALDEEDLPAAFAPYPLRHLPRTQPGGTLSEVVEIYYTDAASSYAAAKAPLLQALNDAHQKLVRRRQRLAEDAAIQANPTALKEKGEAILALAHQIKPGQKELVVTFPEALSFQEGKSAPLKIALDPALSASENAQEYFGRYRKALRAADEIPAQLEKIALEENYLEQLEQDLMMAENRPEIDAVAEELAAAGFRPLKRRDRQHKKSATRYLRLTAPAGATIWVGKNALQNAHLTFNRAAPDDLWLHARDVPGAHVIIPTAQGLPTEADVFWAAAVAAYYSRARHDTSVEVDVTLKKYVRAIKGAVPGLVTYRNESTFHVAPEAPDIEGG